MAQLTPDQAVEVEKMAENLIGRCSAVTSADEESIQEEWTQEQREYFDTLAFLCDDCGWWCDMSECNNEENLQGLCDQCNGDK